MSLRFLITRIHSFWSVITSMSLAISHACSRPLCLLLSRCVAAVRADQQLAAGFCLVRVKVSCGEELSFAARQRCGGVGPLRILPKFLLAERQKGSEVGHLSLRKGSKSAQKFPFATPKKRAFFFCPISRSSLPRQLSQHLHHFYSHHNRRQRPYRTASTSSIIDARLSATFSQHGHSIACGQKAHTRATT